jgi:hypothetical protein
MTYSSERIKAAKDLGNEMVNKEIARCRKSMGEEAWEQHGKWVTENIVTAAKMWLAQRLSEGLL